jgi:peptidylprolyl isomerase/FKBP-type peptidyl-prolyl cis-trans isomerase FklB
MKRISMRIAATALAVLLLSATGVRAQSTDPGASAFMAQNAQAEGVHVLPSGVEYKVVKAGPGTSRRPTPKDYVKVAYEGSLLNGQVFDTTYQSPDPPMFQLKTLIPGWIDAVQQMQEGDEWMIWVPPALGYGPKTHGPIPGGSVLVFRLRLVSILGG